MQGNNPQTLIIAEAGVNHNGSLELAKKLVDVAAESGADIVKFQTFKAANLASGNAKQAEYQTKNTGNEESQLSMLSRLELSYEAHHELLAHCENKNIEFLSTAFDFESLEFIVDELKVKRLKIPSGEITNAPLVLAHARTGLPIIVSTGMASLSDIEKILGVIAFGYVSEQCEEPSEEAFEKAYFSEKGKKALKDKVCVLHCTTEYPAPLEDINLSAMKTLKDAFKLPVGYSDHSEGIVVPIASVALGAGIVEKHFTLDKNMEGPDHKASLEPDELMQMCDAIRQVEKISGDGIKGPFCTEYKNRAIARKSITASKNIKKGEVFSTDNICIKRPGNGLNPYKYWEILGKEATKDIIGDELIK